MKRILLWVVSVAVLAGAMVFLDAAAGDAKDGKKIFMDAGCNKCHSIATQSIVVVKGEENAEEEDDEGEADSDTSSAEPSDLSGVGLEHDAKWISSYVQKKIDYNGKKHKKRFKGDDADRRTLALWLATLKSKDVPEKKAE